MERRNTEMVECWNSGRAGATRPPSFPRRAAARRAIGAEGVLRGSGQENPHIVRQLPQGVQGCVDLVARVVAPESESLRRRSGRGLLQAGRQVKVMEDVLLAQIGRGQILVSGGGKDPEPIVQTDNLRQGRGDIEVALPTGAPIPRFIRFVRQEDVGAIGFETELGPDIAVERGDKRPFDEEQRRVDPGAVRELDVGRYHTAVQQAKHPVLAAEQPLGKAGGADPQTVLRNHVLAQAGVLGQSPGDLAGLGLGQQPALGQGGEVIPQSLRLHPPQQSLPLRERPFLRLAMVLCHRRVRGQSQSVRQVVTPIEGDGLHVQGGG
jgi:hypothetical protein